MRDPLPIDEQGNGSRIRTMAFDEADAPMLMRAMSLAAATALCCSGQESIGRLKFYQAQFAAFAPPAAALLGRETDLCEIGIATATAEYWTIHRIREFDWSKRFRTIVIVGDRRFRSAELTDEDGCAAIAAMVADVAPLSCIRMPTEDVTGNPWGT